MSATEHSAGQGRPADAVDLSERERRRWARELHDETLQGLGGVRMLLAAARQQVDPAELRRTIDMAYELVTDEIQSLRHLIVDLRPRELDEVGLEAAIERLAARVETIGGPDVKTRIWLDYERARHPERLVADIETAAYRIVQEALNNAVKHALARSVHVDVIETGGTVRVRVCDDGRGFDMRVTEDGLGLVGMRERAALVGGSLNIHSSAAGTTVELDMPAVHAG